MKKTTKYYPMLICMTLLGICHTATAQPPLPSVDDGSIVVPIAGLNLIVGIAAVIGSLGIINKRES